MIETFSGIGGRSSRLYSVFFFVIGMIGAIGFRVVLIVNKFDSFFASLVWYTATISYIFFYGYRYFIEQRRRKILISGELKRKLDNNLTLTKKDRRNLSTIVDSLLVSKQNLNLIILIIASFVSLLTQIVLDVLLK